MPLQMNLAHGQGLPPGNPLPSFDQLQPDFNVDPTLPLGEQQPVPMDEAHGTAGQQNTKQTTKRNDRAVQQVQASVQMG
jgi:hypothetical protein